MLRGVCPKSCFSAPQQVSFTPVVFQVARVDANDNTNISLTLKELRNNGFKVGQAFEVLHILTRSLQDRRAMHDSYKIGR